MLCTGLTALHLVYCLNNSWTMLCFLHNSTTCKTNMTATTEAAAIAATSTTASCSYSNGSSDYKKERNSNNDQSSSNISFIWLRQQYRSVADFCSNRANLIICASTRIISCVNPVHQTFQALHNGTPVADSLSCSCSHNASGYFSLDHLKSALRLILHHKMV